MKNCIIGCKKLCAVALTLLLTCCIMLSSCQFIGGDSTPPAPEKKTITIHDGTYSESLEVEIGKQAKITSLSKQGYFSNGYFDSENGGTRYFDASGTSLAVWSTSNPTDFYVQYSPISEFNNKAEFCTDKASSFGYHICTKISFSPKFKNALSANLDKTVKIDFTFNAYDTDQEDWVVYFKNVSQYGEGGYNTDQIVNKYHGHKIDVPSSYKTYSFTSYIPASEIYAGDCLGLFFSRGNTWGDGYIKNVVVNISFQ
ncbi:MAG: hypothetical protein IJD51_06395 [Clostridia bacterium]|nr:hypothetical protein [Clostridia bacterium]